MQNGERASQTLKERDRRLSTNGSDALVRYAVRRSTTPFRTPVTRGHARPRAELILFFAKAFILVDCAVSEGCSEESTCRDEFEL